MFEQPYDSRQGQLNTENDSVECPYCHANILSSNQVIHEAVCARQHRNAPANPPTNANRNERQVRPEPIVRQGSSSDIPSMPDNMRQPQIRREDRRAVENKLINCPNCDQSVWQQNLANHIDNECQGNDKIPCEFCDQPIPITFYTQHVDDCPRRAQEQQNRRPEPVEESKERDQPSRQNERPQESNNRNQQQQGPQQARSRSAEQASSNQEPGGFMDFLHNIASAAYNSLTQRNDDPQQRQQQQQREQQQRQREQQQRQQQQREREQQQRQREQQQRQQQQQNQGGSGHSFLSRLLGVPEQRHQHNQRARATTPPSQHSFDPFGLFTQPPPQERRRQNNGYALVRTVERMPNGSLAVRMRMVPADQVQGMPQQMGSRPPRSMEMEDMGPMGILMSMFGGQMPGGIQVMSYGDNGEMMGQPEAPRGLSKEIMDSLAVVKYDKERNKNVEEDAKSCPICLEEFQNGESVKYLWCMHRFHMGCVDNWLKEHTNCPICKKEFTEAEHHYES